MLEVLLESRGVRTPRPMFEAVISTLSHGAILGLLIAGPSLGNSLTAREKRAEELVPAQYLIPPDKAGPPQEEHVEFMALGGKGAQRDQTSVGPTVATESAAATRDDKTVVAFRRAELVDNAFSALDVDSAAVRDPSSAAPSYPPAMMNLAIEGAATIKFVVDTGGRIDLGTVQTITATNPAFAHAVMEALPRMRFHPARMGTMPVRQTAQEEFKFELHPVAMARP